MSEEKKDAGRPMGNPPTPDSDGPAPAVTLSSAELFAGGHEIWIDHHGELYRLQLTRAGKLILTK